MRSTISVLATLALLLAACGSDSSETTEAIDSAVDDVGSEIESGDADAVLEEVSDAGQQLQAEIQEADLSTLYTAMDLVGFDEINSDDPFTFFAPNDSAFTALSADQMAELLAQPAELRGVLENHLLDTTVTAQDLASTDSATSAGGLELTFDTSGDTPTVNGIDIVRTDVTVGNGVIHIIDGVLTSDTE